MFVILVTFDIRADLFADFLQLMRANARLSLEREEGCEIFDVLLQSDKEARVVLYERYRDRKSFEDHSRSDHYLAFDSASRDMIRLKQVVELTPVPLTYEVNS
jgi:quinol monooxygenase YgiN